MKKNLNLVLFLAVLCVVVFANFVLRTDDVVELIVPSDCKIVNNNCYLLDKGNKISISVINEIKPLEMFSLVLKESNKTITSASVDFKMESMDMGVNKFIFVRQNDGLWKADVVIPVCTTGRRDWLVNIDLLQGEVKTRTVFSISI